MKSNSLMRACRANRGGVLISTLVFSVVIAAMMAGLGCLLTSYFSRANAESNYANAINLADAGINYELRRITTNVANADMPGSTTPYGSLVTFGNGSFRVYCTLTNGAAWDKVTTPFIINSTGIYRSISRTVTINAQNNTSPAANSAIFGITSGGGNGNPDVEGNVGTDGKLTFNGMPTIDGTISLYGSSASMSGNPCGNNTTTTSPTAVSWPTVSSIALGLFPDSGSTAPGGLTYLSLHNDNALAQPAILLDTLSLAGNGSQVFVGKAGGANYYLTSLSMVGNSTVTFNNTNGPITIWVGPAGGAGTFKLAGGAATVKMATNPALPVKIYVATTSGVDLVGNSELDAGVYNVTGANDTVTLDGTAAIYGSIISDNFTFSGNPTINAVAGYFTPTGASGYTFDSKWVESTPL